MTDTNEEIIVAIEPDLFAAGGGKIPDNTTDPVVNLKEQFKEQQALTEREREARQDAERRATLAAQDAARARQEATTARGEVVDSQYGTVTSGLEAAQSEAKSAEQEYIAAFEKGDGAAQATAQRKMARAEAKIGRLEEAKADLESRKKIPNDDAGTRRSDATVQADTSRDPVEAYLANRTEPTQRWLRDHKEWITDPRKNAKLTAAHYSAQAEGITADTPEYFEHVESFIGLSSNGHGNGATQTNVQAKQQRKTSVPAAPVHASGSSGTGGTEVRLSQGEAQAATDGTHVWNYDDPSPQKRFRKGEPIGVQEFARRKAALTKQGAYDRTYTES